MSAQLKAARFLAIDQCQHGTYAVSLDDENGGIRLTPEKCCGRWVRVKAWAVTAKDLRDTVIEFECAAQDLDDAENEDVP